MPTANHATAEWHPPQLWGAGENGWGITHRMVGLWIDHACLSTRLWSHFMPWNSLLCMHLAVLQQVTHQQCSDCHISSMASSKQYDNPVIGMDSYKAIYKQHNLCKHFHGYRLHPGANWIPLKWVTSYTIFHWIRIQRVPFRLYIVDPPPGPTTHTWGVSGLASSDCSDDL